MSEDSSLLDQIRRAKENRPQAEAGTGGAAALSDLPDALYESAKKLLDNLDYYHGTEREIQKLEKTIQDVITLQSTQNELKEALDGIGNDKDLLAQFNDQLTALGERVASLAKNIDPKLQLSSGSPVPEKTITKLQEKVATMTQENEALAQNPTIQEALAQEVDASVINISIQNIQNNDSLIHYLTHPDYQTSQFVGLHPENSKSLIQKMSTDALKAKMADYLQRNGNPKNAEDLENMYAYLRKDNIVTRSQTISENYQREFEAKNTVASELPSHVDEIKNALFRWSKRGHFESGKDAVKENVQWLDDSLISTVLGASKTPAKLRELSKGVTDLIKDPDFNFFNSLGYNGFGINGIVHYAQSNRSSINVNEFVTISPEVALMILMLPKTGAIGDNSQPTTRANTIATLLKNNPEVQKRQWQALNLVKIAAKVDGERIYDKEVETEFTYYPEYRGRLNTYLVQELPEVFDGNEPYLPSNLSTKEREAYVEKWQALQGETKSRFMKVQEAAQKQINSRLSAYREVLDCQTKMEEYKTQIDQIQKDLDKNSRIKLNLTYETGEKRIGPKAPLELGVLYNRRVKAAGDEIENEKIATDAEIKRLDKRLEEVRKLEKANNDTFYGLHRTFRDKSVQEVKFEISQLEQKKPYVK